MVVLKKSLYAAKAVIKTKITMADWLRRNHRDQERTLCAGRVNTVGLGLLSRKACGEDG